MTFQEYLEHYTQMPGLLFMILFTVALTAVVHIMIALYSKGKKGSFVGRCERYYEMIISSTSMLLFIGLYFLVEHRYFNVGNELYAIWDKYDDFLLLLALMISIALMNLLDWMFVPLRKIEKDEKASLRMMAMIYMLIIFAYIKVIYENDNYDAIIVYFLLMVIGRFTYFDATFKDFLLSMKLLFRQFPVLILALFTSGALALYGFKSEYLLKSNGVVLSLCIAHFFVLVEIGIVNLFIKKLGKKC